MKIQVLEYWEEVISIKSFFKRFWFFKLINVFMHFWKYTKVWVRWYFWEEAEFNIVAKLLF